MNYILILDFHENKRESRTNYMRPAVVNRNIQMERVKKNDHSMKWHHTQSADFIIMIQKSLACVQ